MKKKPYLSIYRVQGGIFPSRSKMTIHVEHDGLIKCSQKKPIYIGDQEHMMNFLLKRLGIEKIEDLSGSILNRDVHVIEMTVPYWLPFLYEKYAVEQFMSKNTTFPKLVDKSVPGKSWQISGQWSKLLSASCIFAKDNTIQTIHDIYRIIWPKELNNSRVLDYTQIYKILYGCNISEADLNSLAKVWGLDNKGGKEDRDD